MKPFVAASRLDQSDYDAAISEGLNRVYRATEPEPLQLSDLRAVVISDHHRGARDGADDFERAEPAYSAALGSYGERGYELWLLGDVEELWENDVEEVVPDAYRDLLELECSFAPCRGGPGLRRFWGDHDLDWNDPAKVTAHLGPFLPDIPIQEGLRIEIRDGEEVLGELFLVHGHQGTEFSERFRYLSRFVVRRVWRAVQNSQGWLSTRPSFDYALRAKHDTAMFHWAAQRAQSEPAGRRLLLIAGHTHHPVFPSQPAQSPIVADADPIRAQLAQAREDGRPTDEVAAIRAKLEEVSALPRREHYAVPQLDKPPCYFNGGCCCYPDGDITCLELDGPNDEIRLVRWARDHSDPDLTLPTDSLRRLFSRLNSATVEP